MNFQKLQDKLGKNRVKKDVNLSPYLTLRTDTTAEYFFEANSRDDLINAVKTSYEAGIPLFLLGGGSNLAVVSKKIHGLVVRNMYRKKEVSVAKNGFVYLTVSSGYPVTQLVTELAKIGISGLELHLGLPGTVGGAVYMNSKWTHPTNYFGDHLSYAFLAHPKGKIRKVEHSYFRFAYDYSSLQKSGEILLEAIFKLEKKDPKKVEETAKESLAYRRETQPHGVFCSGCFFKNITPDDQERLNIKTSSAGYLIDRAGLKGKSVGNFFVSPRHANFIINKGKGNSKDLLALLRLIKQRVKKQFGVELEEEVRII